MTHSAAQSTAPPIDWDAVQAGLDETGHASLGPLISPDECAALIAAYGEDARYRSTIDMARYSFGSGQYRYFADPLPKPVAGLRTHLYPALATIANRWAERLGQETRHPATLEAFLAICAAAGQARPTPLILRYGPGDYNCLHQDLYGDIVFPIQVMVMLSDPARDFEGGEFVLTEQRPRRQSRASVVPVAQGHGVAFCVNDRPVRGTRGDYRVKMRHGVSTVRRGERYALGIIFHNAA